MERRPKHWELPKFRGRLHQTYPSTLFSPIFSLAREKIGPSETSGSHKFATTSQSRLRRASIPTPFVPSGHFPLIGGIGLIGPIWQGQSRQRLCCRWASNGFPGGHPRIPMTLLWFLSALSCHCEPVRTLARQSVFSHKMADVCRKNIDHCLAMIG